jgi:hypothetical protein
MQREVVNTLDKGQQFFSQFLPKSSLYITLHREVGKWYFSMTLVNLSHHILKYQAK